MSDVNRRSFVLQGVGALAATPLAALLGGCAALAARSVPVTEGKLHLALSQYSELTVQGGALKVLPVGRSTPVYVLAVDRDRFVALSPICTHLGCTVEIQGSRIVCPCHGSTYDREGRVLQGPAVRSLTQYPLTVTADGVLIVDLERPA